MTGLNDSSKNIQNPIDEEPVAEVPAEE